MSAFTALALAVQITAYIPGHHTGTIGVDGNPILPGLTCSVSQDMAHLQGKWIIIRGYGPRFVNDFMAKGRKQSIDLCVADMAEAREVARQKSEIIGVSQDTYERKSLTKAKKPVD